MSPRWPILLAACVLLAAAASATAQAAPAIRLQTTGDLPFTSDELEQAVGARLTMSAAAGAALVTVGPFDEAGVSVRIGEREAVVSIGAHSGLAAARVVALAIADARRRSARTTPTPRRPSPRPRPSWPRRGADRLPSPRPRRSRRARPRRRTCWCGSQSRSGPRRVWRASSPSPGRAKRPAAFPRRGFDIVAGLGVWDMPKRNGGRPDEVSFLAGVVRAGAGWSIGPVQVAVGPFLAPYRLEGPLVSHTGALVGAGVMSRVGWKPIAASSVEVFGALRVDLFANRVRVAAESPDGFATPRVAASLAIGIGWDLGI